MGKIPNLTDSERFKTPKMDFLLKSYKDNSFISLDSRFVDLKTTEERATLNISSFSNFVLLGDFNIDCNNPSHFLYPLLSNLMQTLSLTQVVPEATHVNTNGTATLIDLHPVNTPSLLQNCEVIQAIGNSNHNGILLQFKWKSNQQQMRSQPRPIWRYAHADFNRACDMIDNTDWDTLISSNDIVSLLNWEQQFMHIINESIPKGTLPKRQNLPYMVVKKPTPGYAEMQLPVQMSKKNRCPKRHGTISDCKKQNCHNASQC